MLLTELLPAESESVSLFSGISGPVSRKKKKQKQNQTQVQLK